MIDRKEIDIDGVNMEGFEVTSTSSTLSVGEGTYENFTGAETSITTYEAFEFDVEGDDELPVVYQAYLIEGGTKIYLERTEVTINTVPFYAGDEQPSHLLLQVKVPIAGTLEDSHVEMRILKHKGSEAQ